MTTSVLAAFVALAVPGQDDSQHRKLPGGYMMDFTIIAQGDQSSQIKSDVVIARTVTQWDKLRGQLLISDQKNAEFTKLHGPLGAMDWGREQVVFARSPQQPTGGYSVTVQKIMRTASSWWIDLGLTAPPPDMLTTQALTTPWVVFRMRKVSGQPALHVIPVKKKN